MEKGNYKREKYKVFGPILMKIEPEKGIDYWTFGGADEFFDEISLRLINKEITSEEMAEEIRLAVLKDPEMFRVEPDNTEELDEIYKDFGPIQIKIDYDSYLQLDAWEFDVLEPGFLELVDKYDKREITKDQLKDMLTKRIAEDPFQFKVELEPDEEEAEDEGRFICYKSFGPLSIGIEEGKNPLYWEFDEMNPDFLEIALKYYRKEICFEDFCKIINDKVKEDPEAFRKKSEWEMEMNIPEYYGKPFSEKDKCEFRKMMEEENATPDVLKSKLFQELNEKRMNGQISKDEMSSIILKKIDEGYDFTNG